MKAYLFGIQKLDFVSADKNEIKGLKLHYGYTPSNPKDLVGLQYDKVFVRPDSEVSIFGYKPSEIFANFGPFADSLRLPEEVDIEYSLEGRRAVFSGIKLNKSKESK